MNDMTSIDQFLTNARRIEAEANARAVAAVATRVINIIEAALEEDRMNQRITAHMYDIYSDGVIPSARRAVESYTRRYGVPAVVYLHPDRIPEEWPGDLPPVQANVFMSRDHVGGIDEP